MEDRLAKAWATLGGNTGRPLDLEKLAVGGLIRGGLRLAGGGGRVLRSAPRVVRPYLGRAGQVLGAGAALTPVAMRGLAHVAPAARQVAVHTPSVAMHSTRAAPFINPQQQPKSTGLPAGGVASAEATQAASPDPNKKSLFDSAKPQQIGTQGSGNPRRSARRHRRRFLVPGGRNTTGEGDLRGGFGTTPAPRYSHPVDVQRQLDASLRGLPIPPKYRNRGTA